MLRRAFQRAGITQAKQGEVKEHGIIGSMQGAFWVQCLTRYLIPKHSPRHKDSKKSSSQNEEGFVWMSYKHFWNNLVSDEMSLEDSKQGISIVRLLRGECGEPCAQQHSSRPVWYVLQTHRRVRESTCAPGRPLKLWSQDIPLRDT